MSRKSLVIMLVAVCTSSVWAFNADYYINTGRTQMFNGTLSGVRLAYQTFGNGLSDAGCADCAASRQLKFLHAVTGTTVLLIRDDGGSVNSFLELGKKFGLSVTGDYWAPSFSPQELQLNVTRDSHNVYQIPADAPNLNQVRNIIKTSIVPQIDTIVAELDSITDTSANRFKIFLNPNEIAIFFPPGDTPTDPRFLQPIEVDYGEVLLLKGMLIALKAQLTTQLAYDTYIDPNDLIMGKIYNKSFSINRDLLDPYSNFLKVLPTIHDSNNGTAILAKASKDVNSAITYYLKAVDYISSEDNPPGTDPQNNELIYIDPNDKNLFDAVKARLTALRLSLVNDTVGTYPLQTTKKFSLHSSSPVSTWELTLDYDIMNRLEGQGSFILSGAGYPSPWKVTDASVDASEIMIEMDYDVPGYWGGALLTGILSSDGNSISSGTFNYWGPSGGTISNMSGSVVNTTVVNKQLDLNPIFGSARYPKPVNLRDLLPQFDSWNGALPNTMGHGLNNNATLGGILPGVTQDDWRLFANLQPSGLFYLQEISPWQRNYNGYVDLWLEEQLIFDDPANDTWETNTPLVDNVDVDRLYMGYDDNYLYGSIVLHDFNAVNDESLTYNLKLSYTPDDDSSLHAIWLYMYLYPSSTYVNAQISYMDYYYGYKYWQYKNTFDVHKGMAGIEFRIPWSAIPGRIPGRFISLSTDGGDLSWTHWNGEDNPTHKQIGRVGTISGTVAYTGYTGSPIFIQAYTDSADPEGSLVGGTVIAAPGPYTIDGIGLGWQGYVRAYTHAFGFNIFGLNTLKIEDSTSVFQWSDNVDDVDLVLGDPQVLQKNVCQSGSIEPNESDWYCFDAVVGGTYTLNLNRGTANYACMTLYDRDGVNKLQELYYWQTQQIIWSPSVNGRYYVKAADGYDPQTGGSYTICMTSNLTCPQTDIASSGGVGVKDCDISFYDMAVLASNWLDNCSAPGWCDGADFDHNGKVNLKDYSRIAKEW